MAQRNMELMVAPWTVEPRFFSTADNAPWVLDLQALSCEDPVLNCWQGCGVRFLIPVSYGGEIEGVVALGGLLQDDEFTYEDYDLMKVLAQQAGANLLALRLTGELSTQREMAAIAQVTTFVLHDIKNHVSGLSLLLDNAREHIANPDFQQDLLRTLGASIQKMNHLMGKLRNLRGQAPLKLVPCDLADIARGAIDDSRIAGIIHEFAPAPIDADSAEIHKVVLNLLLNARDAIETQGAITVCTGRGGNKAFLRVDDTGCGMTEEFLRQRLFRPLETTKDQGLGIGMFQCRNIVQAHGGSLEVDSQLGKGTRITVWLPLSRKIDPLEEGAHG
jgi:putative PEP-CTERM system histidine kinase